MTDLAKAGALLRLARINTGQHQCSVLALEVLLAVAQKPMTAAELGVWCGAAPGPINRALGQWCLRFNQTTKQVERPRLYLIQRRKRPRERGHRYHLSAGGRAFLSEAGLHAPVI